MSRRLLPVALAAMLAPLSARGGAADEGIPRGDTGAASPLDVLLIVDVSASVPPLDPRASDALLDALPKGTRLGIVAFAGRARAVFPFGPLSRRADADSVRAALSGLEFTGRRTELNDGLALALVEGADALEGNAPRLAFLVSDGRLDPGPGSAPTKRQLARLRGDILPSYAAVNWPIHTLARGDADLSLLREISARTGGHTIAARDSAALGDAFAVLVSGARSGSASPTEVAAAPSPRRPSDAASRSEGAATPVLDSPGALAAAAVALAALLVAAVLAGRRRPRPVAPPAEESSDDRAATALAEAERVIQSLRLDLQDRRAASWERERAAVEELERLAGELILMLDHLERAVAADSAEPRLVWFKEKLARALGEAGFEELAVRPGDPFDGAHHKHVADAEGELPRGAVLEVARKGYARRSDPFEKEPRIVRRADVVVCAGVRASSM